MHTMSVECSQNGLIKKNHQGTGVIKNILLMREVNREWPGWIELTESDSDNQSVQL